MLPPGSRNTALQLARACGERATITQETAVSPARWPCAKSWSCSTISSPSAKGECGLRTLLAATMVSGLNTTSKTSVVDLAGLGAAACDAADVATTAARPSTTAAAAPARGPFSLLPLPAARAGPPHGPAPV